MTTLKLFDAFRRLTIQNVHQQISRNVSMNSAVLFRATPCLMAEPLKKKKRLDPQVVKAREERRKKKLEKAIRRLEKNARQLKPIAECEVPLDLLDQRKTRSRSLPALSMEVLESRALLEKQWALYKRKQHISDVQMLDRITFCQQKALDELKSESEELYQEAMQIDFRLIPFKSEGVLETPPLENYECPDGEYVDVSKKWN